MQNVFHISDRICLPKETTADVHQRKVNIQDWLHPNTSNAIETSNETKIIVSWANMFWRIALELTSWEYCTPDLKGSCVLTGNKTKYQVSVLI